MKLRKLYPLGSSWTEKQFKLTPIPSLKKRGAFKTPLLFAREEAGR
jgi:hypothetical protein